MTRFKFTSTILLISVLAFITGCSDKEEEAVQTPYRAAYIINGSAQTLSVFDIEKREMKNDVLLVGKWPADIKILGDKAYVTNTGDNNIQVIDLTAMKQVNTIGTGDGTGPEKIDFVSQSKAYVTCLNTNSVKVIDLSKNQVVADIPVGVGPMGLVISANKAYICNTAYDFKTNSYGKGTVSVIDSKTDKVIRTIDVETNPIDVVSFGDKVVVLCNGNYADITGKICVVDTTTDKVLKTIDLGTTPSGIAISPKGIAYVTNFAGLLKVNIETGEIIRGASNPIAEFANGAGLAFSKDGTCYITVPDWSGAGNDKLLVMDVSEKLSGSYKAGGGASIITIRE